MSKEECQEHEWERNGIQGRERSETGGIYDTVEYVCLNCEEIFTELEQAEGPAYDGSDLD